MQTWRQPQTDTVTDLILLINAMQLLCCCCSTGLSAASWRRCCCIQSAICNTISAQQRKNEVIGKWLSNGGRPSSSSNSSSGHSLVDVHTYVQCLPSSSCHIYFWSSHTKCLASWDYFLAAALPSYSASCCTLPLPLPQSGMQLVSIIKRQRIKLNAYICFGMRSYYRAMSAMRIAMYVPDLRHPRGC